MDKQSDISIVIPTIASADRAESLWRAIRSITDDQEVPANPIVVVNGDRFEPSLLYALETDPKIQCLYQKEGNLPKALRYGVKNVSTKYFGFLDDDDEYTPNALKLRAEPLNNDKSLDVVVSNGYRSTSSVETMCSVDLEAITRDPLKALLSKNWLASCGALFRTQSFKISWLDPAARYLEWTYMAFRLATEANIHFISEPTFVIHDTSGSLSKSDEYSLAHAVVLARILNLELPNEIRKGLKIKLSASFHGLARYHLRWTRFVGQFGSVVKVYSSV